MTATRDEAFELLRQAYSETETWKVAQLAGALMAGGYHMHWVPDAAAACVTLARDILAEARRQVGTGAPSPTRAFSSD